MQRLLEDFDTIVNFDQPIGKSTIGRSLEALINSAAIETLMWSSSNISSSLASVQRECMSFFYRPHLHPELDEKVQLAHKLQFHLLPTFAPPTRRYIWPPRWSRIRSSAAICSAGAFCRTIRSCSGFWISRGTA